MRDSKRRLKFVIINSLILIKISLDAIRETWKIVYGMYSPGYSSAALPQHTLLSLFSPANPPLSHQCAMVVAVVEKPKKEFMH